MVVAVVLTGQAPKEVVTAEMELQVLSYPVKIVSSNDEPTAKRGLLPVPLTNLIASVYGLATSTWKQFCFIFVIGAYVVNPFVAPSGMQVPIFN